MRINNNMLAMNTHRQMGGVALSQAKSMEKLSSGFRINRAGDDAAGLAISEKMRAQIRGLNTAAKNAQDGVSLIQTAEGALQEVHGMLNRMVELATQSANGTYDNDVDRKNLESEVTALKKEVDRVAKSANFNGIKLLNGDLGDATKAGKVREVTVNGVNGAGAVIEAQASAGVFQNKALTQFAAQNKTTKYSIKFNDESGQENRIDIEMAVGSAGAATDLTSNATFSVSLNGKKLDLDLDATGAKDWSTAEKVGESMAKILSNVTEFKDVFEAKADNTGKITFTTKTKGDTKAAVTEILEGQTDTATLEKLELKSIEFEKAEMGKNLRVTVDTKQMNALALSDLVGKGQSEIKKAVEQAIINVDGEKFAAVKKDDLKNPEVLKVLKENGVSEQNIIWDENEEADSVSVARMAARINEVFGKDTARSEGIKIIFEAKGSKASTKGLTLQVGDTNDSFQKLTVTVGDMSSRGLGIGAVSVIDQDVAAKSIAKIKDAINTVSGTRGDLGALQNRLEHTIANINTTSENITASESRIRDVDMAKEMVELTKSNILQQAAQAMLAQANQAPQGVLQLLR